MVTIRPSGSQVVVLTLLRGRAHLHYWLKQPGNVTFTVRNAEGEKIRTLQSKGVAGLNDAVWDIRTDNSKDAPSDAYQITVTAGSQET